MNKRYTLFWIFIGLFCANAGMAANENNAGKDAGNEYKSPSMAYETRSSGKPLSGSNSFNRLLKITRRHQPPTEDGIHDPENDGTHLLQPPREAFENLPKTLSDLGNGVDWVRAVDEHFISPRWDMNDPDEQPLVMDMNIIRFPKGSIPNELFPHRQHTLLLDCSNCHPSIFIPQKGANQISMAANLLGQKCGTCHGKVSFPFSECKRCHSQPKKVVGRKEQRR